MASFHIDRTERAGRIDYRVCGKVDGACAWELRGRIEAERAGALSIDFGQVEEFADYGVAVLSQAVADRRDLELKGLRHHTLRVFRYFGVDARPGGSPALPPEALRRIPAGLESREVI